MRGFGNIPGGRSMVTKTGRKAARKARSKTGSAGIGRVTPEEVAEMRFVALIIALCIIAVVVISSTQ